MDFEVYLRKVPPLALTPVLSQSSFKWHHFGGGGDGQVGPKERHTSAVICKVDFNLLPFSICQQATRLVYVKLRK